MSKKSNYKIIAEAIMTGKIADVEIPAELKKISLSELKQLVEFEMDNAKADKHKAPRDGDCSWDQADPENKKDWQKMLGIKEVLGLNEEPVGDPGIDVPLAGARAAAKQVGLDKKTVGGMWKNVQTSFDGIKRSLLSDRELDVLLFTQLVVEIMKFATPKQVEEFKVKMARFIK